MAARRGRSWTAINHKISKPSLLQIRVLKSRTQVPCCLFCKSLRHAERISCSWLTDHGLMQYNCCNRKQHIASWNAPKYFCNSLKRSVSCFMVHVRLFLDWIDALPHFFRCLFYSVLLDPTVAATTLSVTAIAAKEESALIDQWGYLNRKLPLIEITRVLRALGRWTLRGEHDHRYY